MHAKPGFSADTASLSIKSVRTRREYRLSIVEIGKAASAQPAASDPENINKV